MNAALEAPITTQLHENPLRVRRWLRHGKVPVGGVFVAVRCCLRHQGEAQGGDEWQVGEREPLLEGSHLQGWYGQMGMG